MKHLVNNEQEFIKLFEKFELSEVEHFLRIEFAFEDGTYLSDINKNIDFDEDQDLDITVFRKHKCYDEDEPSLPEKYPVVVLLDWDDSFDRIGPIKTRMIEFVYLSDFEKE